MKIRSMLSRCCCDAETPGVACSNLIAGTTPTTIIVDFDLSFLELWFNGTDTNGHWTLLSEGVECLQIAPCIWEKRLPGDVLPDEPQFLRVVASGGPAYSWEVIYSVLGPGFSIFSSLFWEPFPSAIFDGSVVRDLELLASIRMGLAIANGVKVIENPTGTEAQLIPVAPFV